MRAPAPAPESARRPPPGSGLDRPALRIGAASWPWRPRAALVCLGVAALLTAAFLRALVAFDSSDVGLSEVAAVLLGGGDSGQRFIVLELRMPRALTGALVGFALGLSGAVLQSLARNPLASPDTLGIGWGAAIGAVTVIVFGGSAGGISGAAAQLGVPAGAIAGGLAAAAAVFGLSWRAGVHSNRLLLVGIAVSLTCANLVYWIITWTDLQSAARAQTWITGSLHAADWDRAGGAALALAVIIPVALGASRTLGALGLGDDAALGLGVRVSAARLVLLMVAALLVCVATAAAGPVNFVALAAPQIALRVCRCAQPPPFTSMLLGGALTLVADQLAAGLFAPTQLPVGVFTAVLGAPFLMYLIVVRHREARL
ncbi:FecCD family ABC transporter permease [Streptomonospora wellingtoniae]|uniref:Iron chelate uptake ABC transporter family permease subunit n=1 Tax=Streptomonospora wellingtoniae TaxID=3075544 RepID=A0ABU2KV90_9ACTN|nr:iron chelate uptake ABC transporter family permease subunit [Streptomonospora sp. DSM 45055]MDT0303215.1 iron chelate uptake ABC transporter family permease subunit [Streptomonospora sp. DSM 45055]